jgi:hypothetical protein
MLVEHQTQDWEYGALIDVSEQLGVEDALFCKRSAAHGRETNTKALTAVLVVQMKNKQTR